jgi:citrate synthase
MGFQPDMFTVLFAIPRAAGWLAQWNELMTDVDQKISRPRQVYLGEQLRKVATHSKAADPIAIKHRKTAVAG